MKTDNIQVICKIPEGRDEKGANGLWDLAGELALQSAYAANANGLLRDSNGPQYAEEHGQERIYNILRRLTRNQEGNITLERALVLLYNAIEYIEEMTNVDLMYGDGEDILGITQEEYDEIMEGGL